MLFGKKKEKEVKEEGFQESQEIKLPTIDEIKKGVGKPAFEGEKLPLVEAGGIPAPPTPVKKPEREIKVEELRKVVPLFIKLERYEEVLSTIDELEEVLSLIKNSFSLLEESEKIRTEAVGAIKENIGKIEERIASLNSILLRPYGHEEREYRSEEMKDTLSTLKSQIEKLRQELQSFS